MTIDEIDTLDVFKKHGKKVGMTDLALSTLAINYGIPELPLCYYYTKNATVDGGIVSVNQRGDFFNGDTYNSNDVIRPVLVSSTNMFSKICEKAYGGHNGVSEVEFGEYPQFTVSAANEKEIEEAYQNGQLVAIDNSYTFYAVGVSGSELVKHQVFEYNSDKYVRINGNFCLYNQKLSNNKTYADGDYIWIRVSPIKWLIDEKNQLLISKIGLLSGVEFVARSVPYEPYDGVFEKTKMYNFLNNVMVKDMLQSYKREKEKTKQLKK